MIYKFKSAASGEVIMLQEHAQKLFDILGRDLEERGVIDTTDIPKALQKLDAAMQFSRQQTKEVLSDNNNADNKDESEYKVPLHVRAMPFYQLLEKSLKDDEKIYWGF